MVNLKEAFSNGLVVRDPVVASFVSTLIGLFTFPMMYAIIHPRHLPVLWHESLLTTLWCAALFALCWFFNIFGDMYVRCCHRAAVER